MIKLPQFSSDDLIAYNIHVPGRNQVVPCLDQGQLFTMSLCTILVCWLVVRLEVTYTQLYRLILL